jgi:hypothetical protein
MVDLKREVPATGKVEIDAETLAAIDHGIKDADAGRTVQLTKFVTGLLLGLISGYRRTVWERHPEPRRSVKKLPIHWYSS